MQQQYNEVQKEGKKGKKCIFLKTTCVNGMSLSSANIIEPLLSTVEISHGQDRADGLVSLV